MYRKYPLNSRYLNDGNTVLHALIITDFGIYNIIIVITINLRRPDPKHSVSRRSNIIDAELQL